MNDATNTSDVTEVVSTGGFGLLWVGSEFVHNGRVMRKVGNRFAKTESDDIASVGWPIDVNQVVQFTPNSRLKTSPNVEGVARAAERKQ